MGREEDDRIRDEASRDRIVTWFRERKAREAAWKAEAELTGAAWEDLRAAYFATPEGKYEASIFEAVSTAPPASAAQIEAIRRIFRGTA